MFVDAINKNRDYVKPLVTAYKTPYKDDIYSGIGTVMLINDDGWVLTCKHIAENIIYADKIMARYEKVKVDLIENKVPPKKIYKKHGINDNDAVIFRNVFLNMVDSWDSINIYMHEYLDLALIKFENPGKFYCEKYPVFAKENVQVGELLCRIGYPYPDIECFNYNHSLRDIVIKDGFQSCLQPFPLDGMVTRYLIDEKNNLSLFEINNPTLMGQSGGPVFNKDGNVVGIQIGCSNKDIGISLKSKIKRDTETIKVENYPFINLGIAINVKEIKEFLDKYKVKYKEEK